MLKFPSLTGVIRFLIAKKQYKKISTDKFPSLTGVIRFLIWCIDLTDVTEMFPSLTGVIRFLINAILVTA